MKIAATIALLGAIGCGSASDLSIGSQAEVRPGPAGSDAGPETSAPDVGSDVSVGPEDAAEPDVEPEITSDAPSEAANDASPDGGCPNPILCSALKAALVHRYSFNGTGTVATDSVGTANGTIHNTQLTGNGRLTTTCMSDQYVDLPNGIVKQLTNATFEAWVTWFGCGGWQRVFDFGDAGGAENYRFEANTSLYLTPQAVNGNQVMFGGYKRAGQLAANEARAPSMMPLEMGTMVQIVLVIDKNASLMTLYKNGAFEGSTPFTGSLSMLNDINNWLGRSQYSLDPSFNGIFHEFRIYNAALSAEAVDVSYSGGTDAPFLN